MSENLKDLEAFQSSINIRLFNDVISFIVNTTSKETLPFVKQMRNAHLWYSETDKANIQDQYGFKYLGELLERYEDKIGADIKDFRAIALAMATANELLTDDMFIGNQQVKFVQKARQLAAADIYLNGALYLLYKDEGRADAIYEVLTQTKFTQTEDLIFVLSLFDDFERAFDIFKTQLLSLMGPSRSISVFDNIRMYAWIIRRLHPAVKKNRSKDIALFRALVSLPTSFVKAGDKSHDVLLENKYTAEEIVFANGAVLDYNPIGDTIRSHSIVAEKIVIEMCITLINSSNSHSQGIYDFLSKIMIQYDHFEIKIQGYKGIWDAINKKIKPINPQTFIWLYKYLGNRNQSRSENHSIFQFNILDEKWDVLSHELKEQDYRKIFDWQLEGEEYTSEQIKELISKYDSLTKLSFLASFEGEHYWIRDSVFALLVDKGIINLETVFMECLAKTPDSTFVVPEGTSHWNNDTKIAIMLYIRSYIKGINSKKAFEFYQSYFQKFTFQDLKKYLGTHFDFEDDIYHGPQRNYGDHRRELSLEKSFLTTEEHIQLYNWLDEYMYLHRTGIYTEFIICVLKDDFIEKIIPKEERRQLFDTIIQSDCKDLSNYSHILKEKYLTDEEKQAEKKAEELKKQRDQYAAKKLEEQEVRDKFEEKYNNGTFDSLWKFQKEYDWYSRDYKYNCALRIVKDAIPPILEAQNYKLTTESAGRFSQLCGTLVWKNIITFAQFKDYLSKIEEVNKDAANSESPENDNNDD